MQAKNRKISEPFQHLIFGFPKGFHEAATAKRPPMFEARYESIVDNFSANWNSNCKRQEYLMTFTQRNWRKLPAAAEKAKHSLQKCVACATQHTAMEESVPCPTFQPDLTSRKDERIMTRHALQFVNTYHEESTFIRLCVKTVHNILTYSCAK